VQQTLNVVSLFSGVGGFGLGFEQAGFTTAYQCEWDKHAAGVLEHRWPGVPRWTDVQTLTGAEILRCVAAPDVIVWGSPCQDLSVAGKRRGLEGERSSMFYEGMRIINELREATDGRYPRVSVWENVVGALTSSRGRDFEAVLDHMDDAGAAVVEWAVLDAQHFGVPQRRRRVFVIAVFDPAAAAVCPDPLLPVATGVRGNHQASRQAGTHVAALTANGVGTCGADDNQAQAGHLIGVDAAATQCYGNNSYGGWTETDKAVTLAARDAKGGLTAVVQPIGFSHTQGLDAQPSETVFPTLRSNGGGQAIAYDRDNDVPSTVVRRLTPLECERLMGWPDDHTRWGAAGKEQADTHRYRQCGNGVATPVAKWIATHIKEIL